MTTQDNTENSHTGSVII